MRQRRDAAPATLGRTPPQQAPGAPPRAPGLHLPGTGCWGRSPRVLVTAGGCSALGCAVRAGVERGTCLHRPQIRMCVYMCVCVCVCALAVRTWPLRVDAASLRVRSCVCHRVFPLMSPRVATRVSPRCTAAAALRGSANSRLCPATRVCSAPRSRCVCGRGVSLRVRVAAVAGGDSAPRQPRNAPSPPPPRPWPVLGTGCPGGR